MSSGCGDVLSLTDLQTAKKHQLFEAEVITGKQGGVAGGADIDYATNQVTGQVQKTLPAVLRDAGFFPASFDFTTGGTLGVNDRNKVVYDPVSMAWYSWAGALPKVVPAGTNPLLDANWKPQTDPKLREELAASNGFINIGSVPSMAQLASVDLSKVSSGDKIYVEAYHADSFFLGGRWLFWDAATSKSAHNGITIFDPTKAFGDWSVRANRTAWYTASNSSNGVWRSERHGLAVDADFAGARPYNAAAVDTETGVALISYLSTVSELGDVYCGAGVYRWNIAPKAGVRGLGGPSTTFAPDDNTKPIITLGYIQSLGAGWSWRYISDIAFDCESTSRALGTAISYTTDTAVTNYQNVGRYVFERLNFTNCNIGIRKPYGNIGNVYRSLSTFNVNYGVWASAKSTAPVMHEGNDTFTKCHFNKCYVAAYRTDVTVYGSSLDTVFDQCIFEYNDGFAILQRGSSSNQINVGIIDVRGGHFEGNATAATVLVDGVATVPYTLSFSFTRNVRLQGILIGSMRLQQASVSASQCQFSDVQGAALTKWDIDQFSVVNSSDDLSQYGRPTQGFIVNSVIAPHAFPRDGFVAPLRRARNRISISSPNGFAQSFDGATGIVSATGSLYTSTQVTDSVLGTYSARWTIPAATTVVLTNPSSMTMVAGRYYVWTVHVRWISGDGTLQVAQAGGATLSDVLPQNGKAWWTCFGGLGIHSETGDNRVALRVNGGTTSTVIQTADFQIFTFTRLEEAVAYFNSGHCLYGAP